MAIIRTDPFREFDRLTQQLWGMSHGPRTLAMPMDAYRKQDVFLIQFDLPGVDTDAIELTVENTVLTIKVDRPAPPVSEGVERLVTERPYGTFSRQVFLGDNLDSSKIDAHYEAGVLTLSIPVTEEAKPRRIPVARRDDKRPLGAASSAES